MVKLNASTGRLKSRKWVDMASLVVWLLVIVLANVLGGFVFHRFDLTEENRYTLSETTKSELESLKDVVFVRVYLEGDLPAEFRELRDATQEMLDDFRAYGGDNVQYEFINPSAGATEEERVEVYKELTRQGLQYTSVRVKTGEKMSEQIIFPGAIVSFNGRETPIQLLKSVAGATEQEMIATSIQQLEYEFMSAMNRVTSTNKNIIAFIEGYGSLDALETADAEQALSEFYDVERIEINAQLDALNGVDAIIIARPDSAFSERDKVIIDQFIMRGGKVLWMIDPVFARMDSLKTSNITMATVLDHNLSDQLFKYGARLNNDLIMDLECITKPIVTGYIGNQPRQEMFPWFYEPLLRNNPEHPISNNLDRVKTEFVSSMEAIALDGIVQTPLLQSSEKAKSVLAPTRVSFNILREPPKYEQFSNGPYTTAMLLEGTFPSVFTNRLPAVLLNDTGFNFRSSSLPTKMIVVSDGDIIRNPVSRIDNKFYALGFDKYTQKIYGNRDFLLNAMNYLLEDGELLSIRTKEFKIRLLDQEKIDRERYRWQVINVAAPLMFILFFAMGFLFWRRRKYAK